MEEQGKRPRGRPSLPAEQRKGHNLTIRLRGDLRERLREAAEESGRSLTAEIEYRLQHTFDRVETMKYADLMLRDEAELRKGAQEMTEVLKLVEEQRKEAAEMRIAIEGINQFLGKLETRRADLRDQQGTVQSRLKVGEQRRRQQVDRVVNAVIKDAERERWAKAERAKRNQELSRFLAIMSDPFVAKLASMSDEELFRFSFADMGAVETQGLAPREIPRFREMLRARLAGKAEAAAAKGTDTGRTQKE